MMAGKSLRLKLPSSVNPQQQRPLSLHLQRPFKVRNLLAVEVLSRLRPMKRTVKRLILLYVLNIEKNKTIIIGLVLGL